MTTAKDLLMLVITLAYDNDATRLMGYVEEAGLGTHSMWGYTPAKDLLQETPINGEVSRQYMVSFRFLCLSASSNRNEALFIRAVSTKRQTPLSPVLLPVGFLAATG